MEKGEKKMEKAKTWKIGNRQRKQWVWKYGEVDMDEN